MPPILPRRPNAYTGSPLDRAAHLRDDDDWIAARLEDPGTLFAPVFRDRNLVRQGAGGPRAALVANGGMAATAERWAFLGLLDGQAVFALGLPAADEPPTLVGDAAFADLRTVAGELPAGEAAMLAHARGLLHWRGRHLFCGVCGTACEPRSAGNVVACPPPAEGGCAAQHFPRTDPAVIMLVIDGDRVLLGHSSRFPTATMYSTLAGFVEPGESLEEAVAREVFEEAGVRVGRVHYHSSQPWPFPGSVMIGFHAEAASTEIRIDPTELEDARWFTRAEVANPEAHGFSTPRSDSIASRLIEDWVRS